MTIKEISINLSQTRQGGYKIHIGHNILKTPASWLPADYTARQAVIVADEAVAELYGREVLDNLTPFFKDIDIVTTPVGEEAKSLSHYADMCEMLLEKGVDRHTVLIAFGGGVVGDLTGFVAATLLRGIEFIQIPTTLLAQVDSSIGGKTGVNAEAGKNMVGAFNQPQVVVIDTAVLKTLPPREMKAGYAEILKYGLLADAGFYNWLLANGKALLAGDNDLIAQAVEQSCKIKARIVEEDEFETKDIRALLNLGHTFAHALEKACGFDGSLLHGEAVGMGLNLAARLSAAMGAITEAEAATIKAHLQSCGMMAEIADINNSAVDNAESLLASMYKDKKTTTGQLTFITLEAVGRAVVKRHVDAALIKGILLQSIGNK